LKWDGKRNKKQKEMMKILTWMREKRTATEEKCGGLERKTMKRGTEREKRGEQRNSTYLDREIERTTQTFTEKNETAQCQRRSG
jgi:hypothetical protein